MALWGKTDALASVPKYLETDANNTNKSNDADNAVFVDVTEAGLASNRAKGLKSPGWNLYSNTGGRHRSELLVAMKVSAADAGDLGVTGDTADEDVILVDRLITIGTQPQQADATVDIAGTADMTLTIAATASPAAAVTYKWAYSLDGGTTYLQDSIDNSAATFVVDSTNDVDEYVAGTLFKCFVNSDGAATVESEVVTLTQS
jgi:hypothetical protein